MAASPLSAVVLASICVLPFMARADENSASREHEKIIFNPFYHKPIYTVGVHAIRGLDAAFEETNKAYGEYLTNTAGARFDPPIEFQVKPFYFEGIFKAIDNGELDFLYANPGVYSCIGTEVGATSLVTVMQHLEVRGQTYDLDVYGGVIAVRRDNDEVNTIADLKDKVIGAGAIIDLMGGQMQIYEMERAGMSFVDDPKQVVFTKDQNDVVHGILSGKFDVGFIQTNQIELTLDENGNHLDSDLFKIIEPKIYVMDNGSLFPFLHSTDIFPEWPFSVLPGVPMDVSLEVQKALIDFGELAQAGRWLEDCRSPDTNSTMCEGSSRQDVIPDLPCGANTDLAELAWEASKDSLFAAFRTSRSYFQLRSMQQEAGFLVQDDRGDWYCTRPSSLYEGITCPDGSFRRSETEFINGCGRIGLGCDENNDYDCFCKPCFQAFEVDVYEHVDGEEDHHLVEYYGDELPGCKNMSICGEVEQGDSITLRIYDNMMRDGSEVTVIAHAGGSRKELRVANIQGTYAYEFTLSDTQVRVQVIEVLFNAEPISQSPIRVNVRETDCDAAYGEHSGLEADQDGKCICSDNTYEMAGSCVDSAYFILIVCSAVFMGMTIFVFLYLGYKKKQNDSVWHIDVQELHFNEPPEVIGRGAFGVVVLGQYRGTKVAVKRVLPPDDDATRRGSSQMSGSVSIDSGNKSPRKANAKNAKDKRQRKESKGDEKQADKAVRSKGGEEQEDKAVKFKKQSSLAGDIEAPSEHKRDSISASNKKWEELLQMNQNDNVLKILESATASNHGSSSIVNSYSGSNSSTNFIPLWLKFDEHSRLKKDFINEMRLLSRLRHPCITTVMGAVIAPTVDPMLVMEYMEYGSLHDLLHNETMSAGGEILLQIIRDIVQGIQFLHASKPPILHGDIKAKNILVDSRFRAKVADFGFSHFKTGKNSNILKGTPFFMAPEYLRRRTEYNAACDIYSLGMIFYEIYAISDPFEGEDPRKILPKICHPRINKRPPVPEACPPKMAEIMKKCWGSNPFFRPSAKDLDYILLELSPKDAEPLESAQGGFKDGIKRKPTSLYDVFPKHIADVLNAGNKVEAESHEIVTVVFSDIVGFTDISQTFSPLKVSNMLDRLYQAFDILANKHKVFKVETIGDAYMGVSNLDGSEFDSHVKQIAEYAQDAIAAASQILIDDENPERGPVRIRVGFHSGPVVSNVIGSLNPRYGLFGDTVNTASRMESNSTAGKILCTAASAQLLQTQAPEIPVTLRGKIIVKGKGKMKAYWVGSDRPTLDPIPSFSESAESRSEQETSDGHHSIRTADTQCLSLDDHSDKDLYIQVHASDNGHGHQSRVNMVGNVGDTEKRSRRIW
jgi:guanylate cyclase